MLSGRRWLTFPSIVLYILIGVYDIEYSEIWAKKNKEVHIFNLDPDSASNNLFISPFIVPSVVSKDARVDKLHIEIIVTDLNDLFKQHYKAKLEIGGKGVFIWYPRVAHWFYDDFELFNKDEDRDAHSVHAIKIAEKESLQAMVMYFKFPEGLICANSHFNGDQISSLDPTYLEMKLLKPVLQDIPKVI